MTTFIATALSVVLTTGTGNDTSPTWSPDGKTIAYVSDVTGKSRLNLLDVDTYRVHSIDTGGGEVFQPAWTPDGAIVFSRFCPNGTAFDVKKNSVAVLCEWREGKVSVLPSDPRPGRDYTPCISRDGTIYFTTTRGVEQCESTLARLIPKDGRVTPVFSGGRQFDEGYVSPTVSPDGRVLACAYLGGFYAQWRIVAAAVAAPDNLVMLTPNDMCAYSPCFSPEGKRIAFTGFRAGEIGWGVFVQELASGETVRLDTGLSGNSRAPTWSPDGCRLAFENNASGSYKICVMDVPPMISGMGVIHAESSPQSPKRTDDFAVGDQDFYMRARVRVDRLEHGKYVFFVKAAYEEHPQGILIYLDGKHLPTFATRLAPDGRFVMAQGVKPFPTGRAVEMLCLREKSGRLLLYLDGKLTAFFSAPGKLMSLNRFKSVEESPELLSLEIGVGIPQEVANSRVTRKKLFGSKQTESHHAPLLRRPFEVLAFVDSLDYGTIMDTEKANGNLQILEHVLETGADVVLWRTGAGSTTRYPSMEEPAAYCPAEIRRLPDNRTVYGFLRYPDASPDILRLVADTCTARGVRFGNHSPFEETHWTGWTFGVWNAEHPQYWARAENGTPWAGRCSLSFDEVRAHKLRLAEEILAYGSKDYFLDCWRNGGWDAKMEFVEPELRRWREKHGNKPPVFNAEWRAHVFETTHLFIRDLSARVRAHGARFLLGVPRADDVAGEDGCMVFCGIDWRACVDAGDVDGLIVMEPWWDDKRPFESTREIYKRILRRCGKKCRVYFPVSAYDSYGKGIPSYRNVTGKSFEEIAEILTRLAFEVGGDGITLECVDYNNYPPATRKMLRELIRKFRLKQR